MGRGIITLDLTAVYCLYDTRYRLIRCLHYCANCYIDLSYWDLLNWISIIRQYRKVDNIDGCQKMVNLCIKNTLLQYKNFNFPWSRIMCSASQIIRLLWNENVHCSSQKGHVIYNSTWQEQWEMNTKYRLMFGCWKDLPLYISPIWTRLSLWPHSLFPVLF